MAAIIPRLSRRAWLHLLVYAAVVVCHFAFMQAPGAVAEVDARVPLTPPAGAVLLALAPLPDAHHALAELRRAGGSGELRLIDWGRIGEVVGGQAVLEDLTLARAEGGEGRPLQVAGEAGRWRWLDRAEGEPAEVVWSPPAAPRRLPIAADTLWLTAAGEAITPAHLDRELERRGLDGRRVVDEPALVAGAFVLVRTARRGLDGEADGAAIFRARDGAHVSAIDGPRLLMRAASPHRGRFFYTQGLASLLVMTRCPEDGACEPERGRWASTGGPAIVSATDDPKGEVIALCAADDRLMVFGDEASGVRFLAEAAVTGGCAEVIAIDRRTFAVGGPRGWALITLRPRGGWLR